MGKKRVPLSESGYSEEEILSEAARIMRSKQTHLPKPKVLRPCPKCEIPFGARELRKHIPTCKGKP